MPVAEHGSGKPLRVRLCADEHEQHLGWHCFPRSQRMIQQHDPFERAFPLAVNNLGPQPNLNVGPSANLLDKILRHALQ